MQKRPYIHSLIVFALITIQLKAPAAGKAIDFEQAKPGVARINASEKGAGIILGVRDASIYIMTAYHVVKDASRIEISFYNTRADRPFPGELVTKVIEDLDVAIVKVPPSAGRTLPQNFPQFGIGDIKADAKVSTIGHPGDLDWQHYANVGTISKLNYGEDSRKFLFTSGNLRRGISGGPVFDEAGLLIGMNLSLDPSGNAVCAKINGDLLSVIDDWGIPTGNLRNAVTTEELNAKFDNADELKEWIRACSKMVKGRLHLANCPSLSFIEGYCFGNSLVTFDLVFEKNMSAAWALNVEDAHNYLLFYLSGPEKKFFTYTVRKDSHLKGSNPTQTRPFELELRASQHYRIQIEVKDGIINHYIIPADGSDNEGQKIPLDIYKQPSSRCGSIGFRTLGSEEFTIDDLIVIPENLQKQR